MTPIKSPPPLGLGSHTPLHVVPITLAPIPFQSQTPDFIDLFNAVEGTAAAAPVQDAVIVPDFSSAPSMGSMDSEFSMVGPEIENENIVESRRARFLAQMSAGSTTNLDRAMEQARANAQARASRFPGPGADVDTEPAEDRDDIDSYAGPTAVQELDEKPSPIALKKSSSVMELMVSKVVIPPRGVPFCGLLPFAAASRMCACGMALIVVCVHAGLHRTDLLADRPDSTKPPSRADLRSSAGEGTPSQKVLMPAAAAAIRHRQHPNNRRQLPQLRRRRLPRPTWRPRLTMMAVVQMCSMPGCRRGAGICCCGATSRR